MQQRSYKSTKMFHKVTEWTEDITRRYSYPHTQYLVNILLYGGFWPLHKDETNRYLRFMKIVPPVAMFGFVTPLLISLYDIPSKLNDYVLLAHVLSFVTTISKACGCLWIALYKIHDGVIIFRIINVIASEQSSDREIEIFTAHQKAGIKYTIMMVIAQVSYATIFVLVPYFEKERRYPIYVNLPLSSPIYEFLYFLILLLTIGAAIIQSVEDSLIVNAEIYFTAFLKCLQLKVENARDIVTEKLLIATQENKTAIEPRSAMTYNLLNERAQTPNRAGDQSVKMRERRKPKHEHRQQQKEGPETNSLSPLEEASSTDTVSCYVSLERNDLHNKSGDPEAAEKSDDNQNADYVGNNEVELRQLHTAMDRHITECAEFHSRLIQVLHDFEEAFSLLLFLELLFGAISICIGMFLTTQMPFGSLMMFIWIGYIVLSLWQLYGNCWACSELTEESVKVSDALYFSDWTKASPTYKKSMLIMMSRAVSPLNFIVVCFPLTMEIFSNVVQSGYSYFNLMNQLHNEKK